MATPDVSAHRDSKSDPPVDARLETLLADPWRGMMDPDFFGDPYPIYRLLRDVEPVAQTPIGSWRIMRHRDCVEVLKHLKTGVRTTDGRLPRAEARTSEGEGDSDFMLSQDPPVHTRLRRLVSRAFTPRAVGNWRPRIERIVDEQLDGVAAAGRMDVIADLALPVPATVICEMLGVPIGDRDQFTGWTADATHGLARQTAAADVLERADAAGQKLAEYFDRLIAERRGALSDDMLSTLIHAAEDGDRLSESELLTQSIGLLIAGFETTIGLIGNGIRELILHPDELAKLRAHPEKIEGAVEECLRFAGPILMTVRVLHEDATIAGVKIDVNSEIWITIGSANRDPQRFPDPERFDIDRADNDHLAFGGGTHFCLGAHLARLEAQIAIGRLVERFSNLRLESERVDWGRSLFRVPGRLPIFFDAA